ncbi:Hypothetical predicted protein [Mytilus galloprovincialis]|uniref:EF-hand domain-containing protein n=1 Tax=Mytilus galloprovincialis TaxID=29158 RepID=A0A8B6FWZ8_MYTGA|nr:Hypothetical predicted protein [Mytilus galloprovincialis]
MQTPSLESVSSFELLTSSGALFGNVDSTYHMRHDKVYIFAGQSDSVVKPGNGPNIQRYYNHYTLHSNVKTVFNIDAEHCQPTDNYGGTCNVLSKSNYLNNCGYNAAFELLNWIYGDLKIPEAGKPLTGQLKTFDQSTFFHLSVPITYSFDNTGYIYVPSGCVDKQTKCKLHIALHGCQQGRHFINDEYVKHAGYNDVGEANNIIILYPQITPIPTNLNGCWDWFGYTGSYFVAEERLEEFLKQFAHRKEADTAFDKYTQNFVRRLHKPQALTMFEKEYNLSEDEAKLVFDLFDKDYNGELSYWEYKQFYLTVGVDIKDILATFKEIENDGTGQVDIEKLWDKLKERKTPSGRNFEETELEQLIKASAGDEKQIDVIKFVNLIIRMKQFRG